MTKAIPVEESSGNVFADIGLANPEERLAKADLAIRIAAAIRARRLTQARAERGLKIDQPKVSRLFRSHLTQVSPDTLILFLTLLSPHVQVGVKRLPQSLH